MFRLKLAERITSELRVKVQDPVPAHGAPQPSKSDFQSGVWVNETTVPSARVAGFEAPGRNGEYATVPLILPVPFPLFCRVRIRLTAEALPGRKSMSANRKTEIKLLRMFRGKQIMTASINTGNGYGYLLLF
jgi:hypothetical protein